MGASASTGSGRTAGLRRRGSVALAFAWVALPVLVPPAVAQGIQRPGVGIAVDRNDAPRLDGLYRIAGTEPPGASPYRGAASILATGQVYDFTWWISANTTVGTGTFAGSELLVEFGDTVPLRLTAAPDGRLSGTWRNGEGTETLTPYALVPSPPGTSPAGRYNVSGLRPDGQTYSGTAVIAAKGATYGVIWSIGSQTIQGTGQLDRGILVVDAEGDESPAVYVLGADGALRGLWADGAGEETMTPVTN